MRRQAEAHMDVIVMNGVVSYIPNALLRPEEQIRWTPRSPLSWMVSTISCVNSCEYLLRLHPEIDRGGAPVAAHQADIGIRFPCGDCRAAEICPRSG